MFHQGCLVDTDVLPSSNWPGHLRVHRLVLSALLSPKVIDDRTTVLDLNNLAQSTDDVRTLIELIYTGRLIVRGDRIEPMRRLAIALQFDDLSKILDLACAHADAEVQQNVHGCHLGHQATVAVGFQWREHANRLTEGIADLFRRGCQVDTDVLPSSNWPGHLRVHRLVLAAFLSPKVIDNRTTALDLNNLAQSTDDVRTLIEFIYTGRLTVRKERIEPMRRLAIALQFDDLSKILDLACADTGIKPSTEVQQNVLPPSLLINPSADVQQHVLPPSFAIKPSAEVQINVVPPRVGTNENIERIKDDEELHYKINRPRINEPSRTLGPEDTKHPRKPFVNLTDNNSSHASVKHRPTPGYKPIILLSARGNDHVVIKDPLHSTNRGDDGNAENLWDKGARCHVAISEEIEPQQAATSVQDIDACNVSNIAEKVYAPFQCSHCSKTFYNNSNLRRHVRMVHKRNVAADQHSWIRNILSPTTTNSGKKENSVEMICCHLCPNSFTRESFEVHLSIEHNLTISEINGIDAVRTSGNPVSLERNSGNHTSCQAKHNSVKPKHDFIDVNGRKRFQCQHCPRKFSNKCSLDFHVEWGHRADERNQVTTTEDVASVQEFRLCFLCKLRFNNMSEFRLHLQEVHAIFELHECSHCDFSTLRKEYLSHHLAKSHFITSTRGRNCNSDGVLLPELEYVPSIDTGLDSDSTHRESDDHGTAAKDAECNSNMASASDSRNAQQIVEADVYGGTGACYAVSDPTLTKARGVTSPAIIRK